jgi:phage terminase large subunit GpA-like protein
MGLVAEIFAECLKPMDRSPPWQWAEKHIVIGNDSALPGPWRLANSPFVKELMEVFPDNTVRNITCMTSSQSSKTVTIMILLLWPAANDPGPAMWVHAAADSATKFVRGRLLPMIEDCALVARLLLSRERRGNARHEVNLTEIGLKTMKIYITGSNSPSKLKEKPIRWLFLDEVSEYPNGALDSVTKRVRAFWNSRRVVISTPRKEKDEMHVAFTDGDQREWHFACPRCGHEQPLILDQMKAAHPHDPEKACKWGDVPGAVSGAVWDFDVLAKAIRYECAACGHLMADEPKTRQHIASVGRWIPMNPKASKKNVSFHWNAMLPPIVRWREIVEDKIRADAALRNGDVAPLQVFVNETLGEPWKDRMGEWDDYEVLKERMEDYELAVKTDDGDGAWVLPDWLVKEGGDFDASRVFLAFDVQEKPFYHYRYVCRAFAKDRRTSRLVAFGMVGAEAEAEALRLALGVPRDNTVIDSAHDSARIYKVCEKYKWKAMRGSECEAFHAVVEVKQKPGGATERVSVRRVWQLSHADPAIGTLMQGRVRPIKLYLWSNPGVKDTIGLAMNGIEQCWTIPSEVDREYLRQVSAEKRMEKVDAKGHTHFVWVQKRRDNHYFDCECMIMASAIIARKTGRFEVVVGANRTPQQPPQAAEKPENLKA